MTRKIEDDQSFDAIAAKFEKNIYGSSKGRLRHELLWHYLHTKTDLNVDPMTILDAGGGTGEMTLPLAQLGHRVVLNDLSKEVLCIARQKLRTFDNIEYSHQALQDITERQFDLITCHAVLEWLHTPLTAVTHLCSLLVPGGVVSLSFFNQDAHRFGNLLYGNFDYVEKGLTQGKRVRLNPNNALKPQIVLEHLATLPVTVIHQAGIRCFHDYLKDRDMQQSHYEQIKQAELTYGARHPYMWLGKYFHVIVKRN